MGDVTVRHRQSIPYVRVHRAIIHEKGQREASTPGATGCFFKFNLFFHRAAWRAMPSHFSILLLPRPRQDRASAEKHEKDLSSRLIPQLLRCPESLKALPMMEKNHMNIDFLNFKPFFKFLRPV